jgi:hypothetical protein
MFEQPEYLLGKIIKAVVPANELPPRPKKRPTRARTARGHCWYRDKLACELGGQTAIRVPGGRIDILTPTEIVQVTAACEWRLALSQLQTCRSHFPEHKLRIHLFGKLPTELAALEHFCSQQQVCVTWVA